MHGGDGQNAKIQNEARESSRTRGLSAITSRDGPQFRRRRHLGAICGEITEDTYMERCHTVVWFTRFFLFVDSAMIFSAAAVRPRSMSTLRLRMQISWLRNELKKSKQSPANPRRPRRKLQEEAGRRQRARNHLPRRGGHPKAPRRAPRVRRRRSNGI